MHTKTNLNVRANSYSKTKKLVLKWFTYFMLILFFLSAFSLDSGTWIPTIALIISGVWLIVFGRAFGWFEVAGENIG